MEIFQRLCFPTKTEQDPRKYFFLAMCNLTGTVCSYSVEYSKFPDAIAVKQELFVSSVCSVLLVGTNAWLQKETIEGLFPESSLPW